MNLYEYYSNPQDLNGFYVKHEIIPQLAYEYARDVLRRSSFPECEVVIAKSAVYSYLYAKNMLKGPFPLGEKAIATDSSWAYMYARDVLNGRFKLGEPAIDQDPTNKYWYDRLLKSQGIEID